MNVRIQHFIELVEENRGKFKNKNKVYRQLENIYTYGINTTKYEATELKTCGITLLEKISVDLTIDEQNELWTIVYSLDKKIKVQDIKDVLNSILLRK